MYCHITLLLSCYETMRLQPSSREQLGRLSQLVDHLREQEEGYLGLLQKMLADRSQGMYSPQFVTRGCMITRAMLSSILYWHCQTGIAGPALLDWH